MPRCVDLRCMGCGREQANILLAVEETVECVDCHATMEQIWWSRPRKQAQWGDNDAVLVFQDKEGKIRYPGRHDAKLPDGYERVYLRSLKEVDRFEREHGVVNHTMHYDNNGRAIDDYVQGRKEVH